MIDATEEAIRRGERAAGLLADPILKEAWEAVATSLKEAWLQSPARDTEGREHIWAMLRGLDAVRLAIETQIQDGKAAAHMLALREADKQVNGG
jgi:hypothetical protein